MAENQKTRAKRQQKMGRVSGKVQRQDSSMDGELAFAVQIRSAKNCSAECRRILKILRLHQLQTGVFLRLDARTASMLREVSKALSYPVIAVVTSATVGGAPRRLRQTKQEVC